MTIANVWFPQGRTKSPELWANPVVWIVVGLVVVLVVSLVARRRARRVVLRTICFGCMQVFEGPGPLDFAGFRQMTCSHCGLRHAYPMSRARAAVYVALCVSACVALIVMVLTEPVERWRPAGLLMFVVFFVTIGRHFSLARSLRGLALRESPPIVPMEQVRPVELPPMAGR